MTFAMPTQGRNRVPAITADFWLIKLMAVTMGETAADYLAVNLGFGLTATSLIMTAVLIGALVLQFAQKRYVPWAYWLAVVLISIVGTLVTDNLVDTFGVSLSAISRIGTRMPAGPSTWILRELGRGATAASSTRAFWLRKAVSGEFMRVVLRSAWATTGGF